jgi:hypothetical protein
MPPLGISSPSDIRLPQTKEQDLLEKIRNAPWGGNVIRDVKDFLRDPSSQTANLDEVLLTITANNLNFDAEWSDRLIDRTSDGAINDALLNVARNAMGDVSEHSYLLAMMLPRASEHATQSARDEIDHVLCQCVTTGYSRSGSANKTCWLANGASLRGTCLAILNQNNKAPDAYMDSVVSVKLVESLATAPVGSLGKDEANNLITDLMQSNVSSEIIEIVISRCGRHGYDLGPAFQWAKENGSSELLIDPLLGYVSFDKLNLNRIQLTQMLDYVITHRSVSNRGAALARLADQLRNSDAVIAFYMRALKAGDPVVVDGLQQAFIETVTIRSNGWKKPLRQYMPLIGKKFGMVSVEYLRALALKRIELSKRIK